MRAELAVLAPGHTGDESNQSKNQWVTEKQLHAGMFICIMESPNQNILLLVNIFG